MINSVEAAKQVAIAITEAVAGAEDGLPEGHIYAALMSLMSLELFQAIVNQLVGGGVLERRGHKLYATEETLEILEIKCKACE